MLVLTYLKNQKKSMKKNKRYLKKGFYILYGNSHTYWRIPIKNYNIFLPKERYGIKNILRNIIGKLFFGIRINRNGNDFLADIIYFATVPNLEYKDMKFFDLSSENKMVLTQCANQKRYDLYMTNHNKVEGKFPLPKLIRKDDQKLSYIEELVDGILWQGDKKKEKIVYNTLFEFFLNYYAQNNSENYTSGDRDNINLPLELTIEKNFSVILQHGDLSADNFKISIDKRLCFFDFDHADLFPLFYDIFFLIFNEAVINENYIGYELLKAGEFDKYFKSVQEKNIYLKAYMNQFWKMRLDGIASNEIKEKYLNLYKKLIDGEI